MTYDELPEEMQNKVEERIRRFDSTWGFSSLTIQEAIELGAAIGIESSVEAIYEQISPSDAMDEKEKAQYETMANCCHILVGDDVELSDLLWSTTPG